MDKSVSITYQIKKNKKHKQKIMCGIIGTTDINLSPQKFEDAFRCIYKRGPDNQTFLKDEDFIFGHARLSIVDLDERSNQPFVYHFKNKKLTTVFNGEIYNFLELKSKLTEKGYIFNTTSDTEVVCAAYLEWGISCFDRFEGMWALVIYQHNTKELILARDRVGKKPLYYAHQNNQVYFSSSLWSVSKLTDNKDISEEGLELYFALGYTPDKFSIIQNINKLEPGKILVFNNSNNQFSLTNSYLSVYKNKNSNSSIKKLITNSVEKRIIADVPIATLMSGGVDSTIVTVITKKIKPDIETYFVDFEDKSLSESTWSNYLSKRNNIELHKVMLDSKEISKAFSDYYKVYDEPFSDYSGIPSIAIFRKMAEKFKVVLTGDGGDELFYGYPHYVKKIILRNFKKINNIIKISTFLSPSIKRVLEGSSANFESNYLKTHTIVTEFASKYIDKRFNEVLRKSGSFIKGIIQYDREFNNLPEKYLVKVDRASMFSGAEVRSPFLDEELLQKIKNTSPLLIFNPFRKKIFLKIAYFKIFGIKYFFSKKQGFTPPIKNLRKEMFDEYKFKFIIQEIKDHNPDFYQYIQNLSFSDISKDDIFFDRFFFFYMWYVNYQQNVKFQN